ncbi:MAG: hypothetical protein ACI3ZI_09195, partial [Candidatus Cryptobacteroides sp.]
VMPLISAAMFLGQFLSPLIVSPCAQLFDGVTAPYKVGVVLGLLFIVQACSMVREHGERCEQSIDERAAKLN